MSTNPANWENLFKPEYCPICGEDISINSCDCEDDLSEIAEDRYDDYEVDEV